MSHELPPGVVRGPDGKFVSVGRAMDLFLDHDDVVDVDLETVSSVFGAHVPAADVSGGTTSHGRLDDQDDTELIDFAEFLDSDDQFLPMEMYVSAWFAMHTTSTGENFAAMNYALTLDPNIGVLAQPSFWDTDAQSGVYDLKLARDDVGEALWYNGALAASAGALDTTNGLAAGADGDKRDIRVNLHGVPTVNNRDALFCPIVINTDNANDIATEFLVTTTVKGLHVQR